MDNNFTGLKFAKLNTAAQQREAVVQERSLLPYRLRYTKRFILIGVFVMLIFKLDFTIPIF
jgi:hypothetical protein